MLFGKKNKQIDLEKGKSLYYQYYGNKFGIYRDLGDVYSKCNIPEKIEAEWKVNILETLKNEISHFFGLDLLVAVDRYLNLLQPSPDWLMTFLQTRETDTFTAIIFCEELKNKMRLSNKKTAASIRHFLNGFKVKLLNEPITIHESYKNYDYLRDYDFSDKNIKVRINAI